jgi:hypothetical protein
VQPTPLCGPKIGGILKVGFGPELVSIYRCGAADAQAVGRPHTIACINPIVDGMNHGGFVK